MLSGVTGMMSIINPDVDVDEDGKALTEAGQQALDFAANLTEFKSCNAFQRRHIKA